MDFHFAWQAWHLATSTSTLCGGRGAYWLWWCAWAPWSPRLFAWHAWHLATSTFILRGKRGTWRHRPSLCVAGVALGDIAAAVCVAGMALGDIDVHSAWQAGSGGALGPRLAPCSPRLFAWQAWHLATSTFTLRGKRATWRHRPSLCVAGVALGDMDFHFAWQAWHLGTSICTLRGMRGTWRHRPSLCVVGVALGNIGRHFACRCSTWRHRHLATSTVTFCGRRGAWRHRPPHGMALIALGWLWAPFGAVVAAAVCVASVALGDMDLHFAWQVWHLVISTFTLRGKRGAWRHRRGCLRGRRGTWRHRLPLCVAGVALGDIDLHFWHLATYLHFAWQAWHLATSTSTHTALSPTALSHTTLPQTPLLHTTPLLYKHFFHQQHFTWNSFTHLPSTYISCTHRSSTISFLCPACFPVLEFLLPRCNGGLKLLWMRLCVRSYRVFWNLWLLIAVEWLHDCCHVLLPCAWIDAGLPPGAAKRIVMAAWMLHGLCFGEEAGARNHVCFRVKWLQAATEGSSCVRLQSVRFGV